MPDTPRNVQINTSSIPVGAGVGAALLIVILLLGMFLDLPGIRPTAVAGLGVGVLFGILLIVWRRHRTAA